MTDVLVVDDDTDIREVLRIALQDEGHTVYEAPDGMPALARLRQHPRGMVVLLDLNMPGMDGIQVLQSVLAESALAQRNRFLLVTANANDQNLALDTLLASLSVPVVAKPFDLEAILTAVKSAAATLP